jgi:hypothetical protein
MIMQPSSAIDASLGRSYAEALGGKDFERVRSLLHPDIDFRGLTPGRAWEASDAETVIGEVLQHWFEPSDELDRVVMIDTDSFADRERVAYRFEGHNADGEFVVEQQAYYAERDGRIGWMRVLCSGFRPR